MYLPFNTGKNGYLGHKIYSGISQLADCDYIIFMDEDNYMEPNHVDTYYNAVSLKQLEWCYCLRNIIDKDGNFVCKDMCESLGSIHNVFYSQDLYLVDTNCYCVSKDVIIKYSHIWNNVGHNGKNDPDRIFCTELISNCKNYVCTYEYTLNYRTSSRSESVKSNMFVTGNEHIRKLYKTIPWENKHKPMYVIAKNYSEETTANLLLQIYAGGNVNVPGQNLNDVVFLNYYNKYKPANNNIIKLG